jgi:hypothetical protein
MFPTTTSARPARSRRLLASAAAAAVGIGALLSFTAQPAAAAGTTRYVATNGSDSNPGTQAAPFRTLAKALPTLRAGDTLYVRGGTYRERLKNPSIKAGTSSARITVANFPGERPVVSGLLWLKGASHWTLNGINVTWSTSNTSSEHMVKLTDGTGWRMANAEVWGARSFAGILVAGSPSNWTLDRLYVHDTYATNNANQDHLIYVNTGMGGGTIENSVLAGSKNGRAVKVGPPSAGTNGVGNVTIRYNTMFDNRGPSNVQLSYGAAGNKIYRNIMVGSGSNKENITAYNLNGSGNYAQDNIGWDSRGVVVSSPYIANRGGNTRLDPKLANPAGGDFRPKTASATAYGAHAVSGTTAGVPGSK